MALTESERSPSSTYRVQLHGKFNFDHVAELAGYFGALGISDLYLSPIFAAVPGSQHGYDVTDYSHVNPELGGIEGYRKMTAALRSRNIRVILDIVPNHMGIAGMLNGWWRDVLEFGPFSKHAPFFDIQWRPEIGQDHPRVLVPLLQGHYGRVLENGEIKVTYDRGFFICYGDAELPVRPESYWDILSPIVSNSDTISGAKEIRELLTSFDASRPPAGINPTDIKPKLAKQTEEFRKNIDSILRSHARIRELLNERLNVLNGVPGNSRSFDPLHSLIEKQHYRLARWQAGTHEVNYRRFFAIDTLIGLRMENPEVFKECHTMAGRLIAEGDVTGLRIDHIDGLRQPEDYLNRIQSMDRSERSKPLFVLVEKILARGERLPDSWPVHGSTGYEFMAQVADLFVDSSQEAGFNKTYGQFTGSESSYMDVVRRSKRLVISEMFANAVNNLGIGLVQILATDRLWRDLTRHEMMTTVTEFAVHLPVYRTYRRRLDQISEQDRSVIEATCESAIANNPRADTEPYTLLRDLLLGTYPPADAPDEYRERILGWVLTFQQYTGAIMAKSVEDTAFFNYNRLIALDEVGCDPGVFGAPVDAFHESNEMRLKREPFSLLASSTHDSKLSEDVRARLFVLPELSSEWNDWLVDWKAAAARHVTAVDSGGAPDALDQYRLFQALLAAWPLSGAELDESFRKRMKDYFRKTVDEAKRHTSILNNNESYLAACDTFIDGILTSDDFLKAFQPCAARIARLGMVNSLAQLVLKCTVPGIPDFYQGNEQWDFSLVDPDNRRPVDFGRRQEALNGINSISATKLLEDWHDGRIKLRVTENLLRLRQRFPELLAFGSYRPIRANGSFASHVVAFERQHGDQTLVVAVPRFNAKIGTPPVGLVWDDTRLSDDILAGSWSDIVTKREFTGEKAIPLRTLFGELPFAVIQRGERN